MCVEGDATRPDGCHGTPFTCPGCSHCEDGGCPLDAGFCRIDPVYGVNPYVDPYTLSDHQKEARASCLAEGAEKVGNQCAVCKTATSVDVFTFEVRWCGGCASAEVLGTACR